MANQTYIRILQVIEAFSNEHLQIKRFASDFPAQIPNFGNNDEEYPILFVSPTDSIFNTNTNTFDLRVYCFDIIEKDRANISTILSDTNSILNDLQIWLRDGDIAGIDVLQSSTSIPINNSLLDYCAGWYMDLKIEADTYSICEIPFNETPTITDICNDIIFGTVLTCENLVDCPIIIDIVGDISVIQMQISGITSGGTIIDTYITGGTYSNSTGTATFTRNNGAQFNVTGFTTGSSISFDVFVTGGTYNPSTGIATYVNNTGGTFSVSGFNTNITDIYVTGGTYNNGSATFTNNTGGTFTVNGFSTGSSSSDIYVTGGTYNGGTATFINNTGGTFNVTGFTSTDVFTTGFTFNNSTYDLSILRNDNVTLTTNLSILASDMVVTGGTYDINTGVVTFTNNSGGTFNVTGFTSGMTDTYTTGGTYSNGTILFTKSDNTQYSVSGLFTGNTDVFVTGGTYSNGSATFTNNTGGTFNVSGFLSGETDTLQTVTTRGSATTTNIQALSFIKSGGTSTQILMANGSTMEIIDGGLF